MELENLLDLYLTGQVELFETILKGSPEYKKELLQYVEDTYGWAKYYARTPYQEWQYSKSIFKDFAWWFFSDNLLISNETHVHFINRRSIELVLPKKAKLPPLIKDVTIHNERLQVIPEYLFDDRVLVIAVRNVPIVELPNFPKGLRFLTISGCPNLKELPPLPSTLKEIECCRNPMMAFPTRFPTSLNNAWLKK